MRKFDGFAINLLLEGEEWLAHFSELPNISAYGDTPEAALEELTVAWNAYKDSCRKHNDPIPIPAVKKEYSGQFNIRIDKRVHQKLALEAERAGITLNALVSQKLSNSVHEKRI